MECINKICRIFVRALVAAACLTDLSTLVLAQDDAKPAAEKWRPRDGLYAGPGKGFIEQCGEFGDVILELGKREISGNEWNCKVTRVTDTAPDAVKLDMTCDDYNLAEFIDNHDPNPYDRKFKEIMLLRKIDEKSIFVRKTANGEFKYPEWRAAYCPKDAQGAYAESLARSRAEVAMQRIWRPRDGVYARPGADFGDRCLKSGDVIVGLAKKSVSSGAATCSVSGLMEEPPEGIKLGLVCDQKLGAAAPAVAGGQKIPERPVAESMLLRKMDDKTVWLRNTQNGEFTEPERKLSYCGAEAQRKYTESNKTQ